MLAFMYVFFIILNYDDAKDKFFIIIIKEQNWKLWKISNENKKKSFKKHKNITGSTIRAKYIDSGICKIFKPEFRS